MQGRRRQPCCVGLRALGVCSVYEILRVGQKQESCPTIAMPGIETEAAPGQGRLTPGRGMRAEARSHAALRKGRSDLSRS